MGVHEDMHVPGFGGEEGADVLKGGGGINAPKGVSIPISHPILKG